MSKSLRDEIGQTKPFTSLEEEVLLGIVRTGARLEHAIVEGLKPYGVTPTQYNVLRILRGAGKGGLRCDEVRRRMLKAVPDTTRLLDRLATAGLVVRERDALDRRAVVTRITERGLDLLERMDVPVRSMHGELVGHMADGDLRKLADLLTEARGEL
jgi:DNA-binding MarR family transcriptional regulator